MLAKISIVILLLINSFLTFSQENNVARYYFNGSLNSFSGEFPALKVEGPKGEMIQEVVEKLGRVPRTVYEFPKSSGLVFDNSIIKNFIRGSYAIEMFFRYDDGQLLLYNQLLGNDLENSEGKYVHLVVTRDHESKQMLVYLNGLKKFEFTDSNDGSAMDNESQVTFFKQGNEVTSSGAVAMIKIYDYFISEDISQELFKSFTTTNERKLVSETNEGRLKLENLYFVQSKSDLLPESLPTLDQVVDFLVTSPDLKVEVQGHTDNNGDFYENIKLSIERAKEIKKYLLASGIESDRVGTRGFGGSRPVESNNFEETRKLNRRVELEILK